METAFGVGAKPGQMSTPLRSHEGHTRRGHVRGARALDLLDILELFLGKQLVEVSDDLV